MPNGLTSADKLQAILEQLRPLVGEPIEATPEHLSDLWQQGQAALENGDHELALDVWCELVSARPAEPSFHFGYGLALQQLNHIELAGRHFSYAYALDPADAACAYRLGECLAALGYTLEAHDALLAAQQLCDLPHNPPHVRQMALELMESLQ